MSPHQRLHEEGKGLCCLHIALRPIKPLTYEGHPGRHVHAAVMGLLQKASPAANSSAHKDSLLAIGPLLTPPEGGAVGYVGPGTECSPQKTYWFRAGCAAPEVTRALLEGFASEDAVTLGRTRWSIDRRDLEDDAEPLGFGELAARAGGAATFGIQLLSPTYFSFRERGATTVLPQPAMVFRSLVKRWEGTPGAPELEVLCQDNVTEIVGRSVAVEWLQLEMDEYGAPPMLFRGAVGQLRMRAVGAEAVGALLRDLNVLTSFASYVGVGAKTSLGCGQARRIG
jgi:CRISPR-associated endoribonuclease Cas6